MINLNNCKNIQAQNGSGNNIKISGDQNKVSVDQPKTGFLSMLFGKIKFAWKWIVGLFA